MGNTWGVPFRLVAAEDGRLIASRAARDFVAHVSADGTTLEVEADARFRAEFSRAPADAALPADLPGRYACPETDATWTISAQEGAAAGRMEIDIAGPLSRGGRMHVLPIDGDIVRVVAPRGIFDVWMDARVLRDNGGTITGLHVEGGRARGLLYAKAR